MVRSASSKIRSTRTFGLPLVPVRAEKSQRAAFRSGRASTAPKRIGGGERSVTIQSSPQGETSMKRLNRRSVTALILFGTILALCGPVSAARAEDNMAEEKGTEGIID